jgi:hypothetical protein
VLLVLYYDYRRAGLSKRETHRKILEQWMCCKKAVQDVLTEVDPEEKKKGKKRKKGKRGKKRKSSDDEDEEIFDDDSDSEASNLRLVAEYEERQNELKEREIIKESGGDEQRERDKKEEKERKKEEKKLRPMEPRIFFANQWEGRGGEKGPTREELIVIAKAHLDANPLLCRSAIQIIFDDEVRVFYLFKHLLMKYLCDFVCCRIRKIVGMARRGCMSCCIQCHMKAIHNRLRNCGLW